jgi:peptide/nickel transport system substrate-binding protein
VAGCSNGGGVAGSGKPAAGGTLTEVISADPGSLDPQSSVIFTDIQLSFFAYDRLVLPTSNGTIQPYLASSWSANSAGTQYTFTIRKSVTCSDGSTLTPAAVAANFAYVGNPKNASPLLGTAVPAGTTATAVGDTVVAKLPSPEPFFLNDLSLLPIVCQKGLSDRSTLAHGTDGTGPYALSGTEAGSQYTYTLRKGYAWGPNGATSAVAGMPSTVVLKVVSNETTAANLLVDGGAQVGEVNGADRTRLSAANLFHAEDTELAGELFLNQATGQAGADPTVRRALAMGLNLPQVGTVLTDKGGTPAHGLIAGSSAPCSADTVTGNVPGYNVSQAESLLTQDGWTAGAGGTRSKDGKQLALTLLYATDVNDTGPATELMQQQLQQLGVQVALKGLPSSQVGGVLFGTGAWDMALVPVGVNDPAQLVPFFSGTTPPNGDNFAHIQDSDYLADVAQAEASSATAGCAAWNAGAESLMRAVDVVPFEDDLIETWGNSATFATFNNVVLPTSLRLLG